MNKIKMVMKYLSGYNMVFIIAVICIVIATIMELLTPLLIMYAIDSVIGDLPPAENMQFLMDRFGKDIFMVCVIIMLVAVVRGVFTFFKGKLVAYGSESIIKELRDKVYAHIQHLSFEYHSKKETGDLVQRCTSDIEIIRKFISIQLVDIGRIVFLIVFIGVTMYQLDPLLMFVGMIMIPLLFLSSFLFFTKIQKVFRESDEAEGKLTVTLQENLSGVRVVRAFGQERAEIDKFETVNKEHTRITMKIIDLMAYFWSITDIFTLIQSGLVLVVGTIMAVNGRITLGTLVAVITYESMLLWPVKQLGRMLSDFGKTIVSIERINEIFEEPIESQHEDSIKPEIKGGIEFKAVSFNYDGSEPVLKDINLKIEHGQTIGILGATGSGKSTIVQLLQRLYEYDGSLKIDGHELNMIDKEWIRSHVGLILQEPYLYAKTIRENIGISNDNFDECAIISAANVASIHESILEFKNGYDTVIGEKGVSLSGGQKQRIAIARSIIDKSKKILIFDDSLSAVDSETDIKIRKALLDSSSKVTTIIISHRISTLSETDRIIVMDKGEIIQNGTHKELIEHEGTYQNIWNLQNLAIK